jgi:uncharacterized membrane protein
MRFVDLVCRPDARQRLVIGLAAGAAIFFASRGHLRFASAMIAGWNASALVIVALDWLTILTTPQRKIRELAQQQDLSRFLIFLFVIVAACAALFAVHQHAGGLIFPGDRPPDYFDFAYFSFVIGMTCQVSDVQITSRRMRRLTLVHSVLSFGFNTIILALLINTVSGLL